MTFSLDRVDPRLGESGLFSQAELREFVDSLPEDKKPQDSESLLQALVREKRLTTYQAKEIGAGRGQNLVLGNYVVLDRLGHGGMGVVFKAQHLRMQRVVALKVLSPDFTKDPEALKRFQREVVAAARLVHPHIVTAYDADEAKGMHFLVMEYVAGKTLSQLVKETGPLSLRQAVWCLVQAARGLEYAHQHGVVHRDVKPSNLLYDAAGKVKVLDLGLARLDALGGTGGADLTTTGDVMGTIDYMAPEQAESTRLADARSDVYSLGMTLWYLLTGRPCFEAESIAGKIMAHREMPLPSLVSACPGAPHELDDLFQKLAAKHPDARYQSMTEAIVDLERFLRGLGEQTRALHDENELTVRLASITPRDDESVVFFKQIDASTRRGDGLAATLISPASKPAVEQPTRRDRTLLALVGAFLGGAAMILLTVFLLLPPRGGNVFIEVTDPDVELTIDNGAVKIVGAVKQKLALKAGEHDLAVKRGDTELAEKFTVGSSKGTTLLIEVVDGVLQVKQDGQLLGSVAIKNAAPTKANVRHVLEFAPGSKVEIASLKLDRDGSLTLEAYVTAEELADGKPGVLLGAPQQFAVHLDPKTNRISLESKHEDGEHVVGPLEIAPGQRTHVAAVRAGNENRLYISGILVGRKRIESPLVESQSPFTLGGDFAGSVEEVRVSRTVRYAESFTPAERFEPDAETLALYHVTDGGEALVDSSGNEHTGTISGAKWVTVEPPMESGARVNYLLEFDGATSHVRIPEVPLLPGEPLTIEAWCAQDESSSRTTAIVVGASGRDLRMSIGTSGGTVWSANRSVPFKKNSQSAPLAGPALVHLAGVWDGSEMRLYVNGRAATEASKAEDAGETINNAELGLTIGAHGTISRFWKGQIDEVRVSKVARYNQDFTPRLRFESDRDTLALYHCDEGSGDLLLDSSGNEHHGKIVGARWVRADGSMVTPEGLTWALEFDGRASHVELPSMPIEPAGGLTLEAFVLPLSAMPFQELIQSEDSTSGFGIALFGNETDRPETSFGAALMSDAGGVKRHPQVGTWHGASSNAQVPLAAWSHLAAVFDSKNMRLYRDGREVAKYNEPPTVPMIHPGNAGGLVFPGLSRAPTAPTFLGKSVHGNFFRGRMAAARISRGARYQANFAPRAPFSADGDTLALYRFEDAKGDVLTDSSGNNRHGTIVGATWVSADSPLPWPNYLLEFDGRPAIVDIDSLRYDGTHPITIEAWVNHKNTESTPPVFVLDDSTSGQIMKLSFLQGGRASVAIYRDADGLPETDGEYHALDDASSLPAGLNHVAGCWDPKGNLSLYVNGRRVGGARKWSRKYPTVSRGLIGAYYTGEDITTPWEGQIDELRISRIIRYEQDFTPLARFEPDAETIALYHCDEGSGTVLVDSSGNNHHGKITAVKYQPANSVPLAKPEPAANYALRFDGKTSYVEIPTLSLEGTAPATVEAWLNCQEDLGVMVVAAVGGKEQLLSISGGGGGWSGSRHFDGSAVGFAHPSSIKRARKTHVASVWDGELLRVFVDGKEAASRFAQPSGPPVPSAILGGVLNAAAEQPLTMCYSGLLDEVRVSKVARYDEEFIPESRFEPDAETLALYHFDEGTGSTLFDSSGNGHHGKIVGATWDRVDSELGVIRNLLVGLDAAKDGLTYDEVAKVWKPGSWQMRADGIRTGADPYEIFRLPVAALPANYSLFVEFEPQDTTGAFLLPFTAGPSPGYLVLNGAPSGNKRHAGFGRIDGLGEYRNVSTVTHTPCNPRERHTVQVDVRSNGGEIELAAALDGKPLTRFNGLAERMRIIGFDQFHDGSKMPQVSVGSMRGSYLIRRVELHPLAPLSSALEFDGVDDYVEIPSLKYGGTHPLTIEAYAIPERRVESEGLVQICGDCWLSLASRQGNWSALVEQAGRRSELAGGAGPRTGERTHLAAVWNEKELLLFVNGKKTEGSLATIDSPAAPAFSLLGAAYRADSPEKRGSYYGGVLDEIRISKVARYDKDFTPAERFEADADTLALYHCDEGLGNVLADLSGSNHHGKIQGAKWLREEPVSRETPHPPALNWTPLFNGRNLAGWKYHPTIRPGEQNGWEVVNGELRNKANDAHIFSERGNIGNFHLRAQVLISKDASGVSLCFRAPFELPQYPNDKVNFRPGTMNLLTRHAGPEVAQDLEGKAPYPADAWFDLDVIAQGNHFVVKVNGKEALDTTYGVLTRAPGHLVLSSGTNTPGAVAIRKLEINDLPPLPAVAPFEAVGARAHQEAWASHLSVPLGYTDTAGMKFVLIPPGEFICGQEKRENTPESPVETPAHLVTLTTPFYISRHEVTQRQYEQVMGKNPSSLKPEEAGALQYPVETVSWDEAVAFCEQLTRNSREAGAFRRYRLPTGAEWEYACRAGTNTIYSFGDDPALMPKHAWTAENSNRRTQPVGQLVPNQWGLFDMHGNVWEWCQDYFAPDYYRGQERFNPRGPLTGVNRTYRGTSILDVTVENGSKMYHRCACRWSHPPAFRTSNVGFRVVCEVAPSHDADRRAAEWAIAKGGFVIIKNVGNVQSLDKLPAGRFTVTGIDVFNKPNAISDDDLQWLRGLSELEDVHFNRSAQLLTDRAVPLLLEHKNLKRLRINGAKITDSGAVATRQFPSLEYLALSNSLLTDKGLASLRALTNLQMLNVGWSQVSMASVLDAAETSWPQLSQLRLGGLPLAESEAERLSRLVALTVLELEHASVVDAYLPHFASLPKLETLWLKKSMVTDKGLEALYIAKGLRSLQLYGTPVTAESVKKLSEALPLCRIEWDDGLIDPNSPRPAAGPPPATGTFKNTLGMEFALVPKGKSWHWGSGGVPGTKAVEFRQDFYLGKYEVTQAEWEAVMGMNPSHYSRAGKGASAVKDIPDEELKRFPVENVSYHDIQGFLAKLNERDKEAGWVYRLPNEIEWEYACRGGPLQDQAESSFSFYAGEPSNALPPSAGNMQRSGLNRPSRVGSYAPNRLGLCDMHGNLGEWCENEVSGPAGPPGLSYRISRGGGFNSPATGWNAASRFRHATTDRVFNLGFRVARIPVIDPERRAAEWAIGLGGNVVLKDHGKVESLDKLPAGPLVVTEIEIHRRSNAVRDDDLLSLCDLTALERVNFVGSSQLVSDAGLATLVEIKSLKGVRVAHARVSEVGVAALRNLPQLDELELWGVPLTQKSLELLREFPKLRDLNLGRTGLTATAVLAARGSWPELTRLNIGGLPLTDGDIEELAKMKTLTHLGLLGSTITETQLERLSALPKLEHLRLQFTQLNDSALSKLPDFPELRYVILLASPVTAEGIQTLSAAMPKCRIEWDGGIIEPSAGAPPGASPASPWRFTQPVPFNTPEGGRMVRAMQVFPRDNAWNADVSTWPLHPDSATLVNSVGSDKPLRYSIDLSYILVPADQKRVDVKVVDYAAESDPGPFPIPDNVPIAGWPAYFARDPPLMALSLDDVQRDKAATGGDRQAIVVDPAAGKLYEFFKLKKTDTGWEAAQASIFDLSSNKLRPSDWASADSAGLPLFPALIRFDELQRGMVDHAMRFTVPKTSRAYVAPATHYSATEVDPALPRMGERFRLKADFDTSKFSPHVQAILKGLKKHGMLVAGNGQAWGLSCAADERIGDLHEELRGVTGAAFEVVVAPTPK